MNAKQKKTAQGTIEELFKLLEIDGTFTMEEKDDFLHVILETEDSGIVIGRHGDMLDSLQFITALCLAKKLGEFKRVSLEVGDYKKNREDYLKNLAEETKNRVVESNQEVALPELKPWERRVIHLLLQNDEEVSSESVGEGKERTLVVKPKA